ncbi:hypothetical protein EVAR_20946_1 [Eumeta japonica]|uniref:Uncharacterized protein n=1 Tax=Eumeta variegata TaxID=151549 RepID=A0A4C1UWY0_EUMVA|nr:hypothetical protein EVAR_20946_1 [Eumeta japonica]
MSILISSSELHNQIDSLDEDPSKNVLDRKGIPANENKFTSDNNMTAEESITGGQNSHREITLQIIDTVKVKRVSNPSEWNDTKIKEEGNVEKLTKDGRNRKERKQRDVNRSERKLGPACTSNHCKKIKDCLHILEI